MSPIQAVERAARILCAFTAERPVLGLAELARVVGLSKSTVRRFALSLERSGLLASEAEAGRYRLGVRCLTLGAVAQASVDLHHRALPIVRRLVRAVGETVYLLVPRGLEAVCLEIAEASRGVRVLVAEVGSAFPLHAGAAPRALLAAASEATVRELLDRPLRRYTPATMTDARALRRDIAATRAAGCTVSVDDLVLGIASVGAVVWDGRGQAVAALSVSGTKDRILGPGRERIVRAVTGAARELSLVLGCPAERLLGNGGWIAPDPAAREA